MRGLEWRSIQSAKEDALNAESRYMELSKRWLPEALMQESQVLFESFESVWEITCWTYGGSCLTYSIRGGSGIGSDFQAWMNLHEKAVLQSYPNGFVIHRDGDKLKLTEKEGCKAE